MPPHLAPVSPDQDASQHLGCLRELASGVDALYLSGRGEPTAAFLEDLEGSRRLCEMARDSLLFHLDGELFDIYPHGWGRYHYLLAGEMGSIGITTSKHLPAVRVQPRSALLHAIGPQQTVDRFRVLLGGLVDGLSFSVNRVDLYADFQGWELDAALRERFVCRGNSVRVFEDKGRFQGIQLGMRSTKTLSARVYDKTADIAQSGADWWITVWGDAYDPTLPVFRIELEIGRKAITDFALDTPEDVLAAVGDLWRYGTGEWLTYRTPSRSSRSRWPIAPEWRSVQLASLAEEAVGAARIQAGKRAGSIRRIFPALTGYLAAFAAAIGTSGIEDTLVALDAQLRNDEIARHVPFEYRVVERRSRQQRSHGKGWR